jgi:hypothetical protein
MGSIIANFSPSVDGIRSDIRCWPKADFHSVRLEARNGKAMRGEARAPQEKIRNIFKLTAG